MKCANGGLCDLESSKNIANDDDVLYASNFHDVTTCRSVGLSLSRVLAKPI